MSGATYSNPAIISKPNDPDIVALCPVSWLWPIAVAELFPDIFSLTSAKLGGASKIAITFGLV